MKRLADGLEFDYFVGDMSLCLRPRRYSFSNLLPELQRTIIHYLDFWDQVALVESHLLAPESVMGARSISEYDEDGNSLLHVAVKQNYESSVKFLLSAGAPVSAESEAKRDHRATPLVLASQRGNPTVVKMLLDSGASVNEWNYSGVYPLHYASEKGHTSVVQLLLESGAKQEPNYNVGTPLHLAASNGHAGVVRVLISHGAELASLRRGVTALWLAVANCHPDCVRILLEAGAAENEPRDSALTWPLLHLAASGPHLSRVDDLVLEPSVEKITCPPALNWKQEEKQSWAEIIRLLVTSGADVNEAFQSVTPLQLAALVGNYPGVEILLNAGADVHSRNTYGRSALIFACLLDHRDIVHLLLDAKRERPNEKKPAVGPKPKLIARCRQ
jgi:ankyrin repeat protein